MPGVFRSLCFLAGAAAMSFAGLPAAHAQTRCTQGDVNGDGAYDGDDIAFFMDALFFGSADPDVICSADLTGDGQVNVADIPPFVQAALAGGNAHLAWAADCGSMERVWWTRPPGVQGETWKANAANAECDVIINVYMDNGAILDQHGRTIHKHKDALITVPTLSMKGSFESRQNAARRENSLSLP